MKLERLFKVLDVNGHSFHGGSLEWSLPKGKRPGRWHKVKGEIVPCKNGLHLCRERDLINWLGPSIFLAEARSERIDETDKVVVREARLVRRLDTWNDRTARLFAVACARRALERERATGREPVAASWSALEIATNFANGRSTVAELNAALAAALDAARAAARAAARDAALAAAWAAARDAAWDAAWAAARDAALAAEREWQSAQLMCMLFPGGSK